MKKRKLTILVIIVILLIGLLGGYLVATVRLLNQTTFPASISQQNSLVWDGSGAIDLALIRVDDSKPNLKFIRNFFIVRVDPAQPFIQTWSMPASMVVNINEETVLGKTVTTSYKLEQLYNHYLTQQELNPDLNAENELVGRLEGEFAINIDRYLILPDSQWQRIQGNLLLPEWKGKSASQSQAEIMDQETTAGAEYLKQLLLLSGNPIQVIAASFWLWSNHELFKQFQTNLSGAEILKLWQVARTIPEYRYETMIISGKYLQDDRALNKTLFDQLVRDNTVSQSILLEQTRIDVVNGSGKPGLASRTSRLLQNYGLNVVRQVNSLEPVSNFELYVPQPQKYEYTVRFLSKAFPGIEVKYEEYPYRQTGDLLIVVV